MVSHFLVVSLLVCVFFVVLVFSVYLFFFFFKQKTAYEMRISDWSSDVCSSDLIVYLVAPTITMVTSLFVYAVIPFGPEVSLFGRRVTLYLADVNVRSEERRVGKECVSYV